MTMVNRALLPVVFVLGTSSLHAQPECVPSSGLQPWDSWQTVPGSYDADGWTIFTVTVSLGVAYTFKTGCGDGATADHDTFIEVLTPACTVVQGNDDACEEGRSRVNFNSSFADGTLLWVRVRGAQGQGGGFTMAYRSIWGEPGPCNECPSYDATLLPSSQWQTISGAYGTSGCKVYRIVTTAGMEYDFKTGCGDGATADHDTYVEVYSSVCGSLTADDNSCEFGRSSVSWTSAGSGAIHVKVSAVDGGGGSFTMAYRRNGGNGSICGACTDHDFTISPGTSWSTHGSSYLEDGCQYYRFTAVVGYEYTFKTGCGDGAGSDHSTRLELFDDSCDLLAEDAGSCGDGLSVLQFLPATPGPFYLRVSGVDGENGFYTMAHSRAPESGVCPTCPDHNAEITPALDWQHASGSYLVNGCWMYKVNVEAGHTYVFQTAFGDGANADHEIKLTLMDDGCVPVFTQWLDPFFWWFSQPRLYHLADSTGVVYLKVNGVASWFGSHTLAYRDLGASVDDCADVVPIKLGSSAVQLTGTLADATSDEELPPESPLHGLPVKWYAFDIDWECQTLVVSYCDQYPAWTNTLNFLTTDCIDDLSYSVMTWDHYCHEIPSHIYHLLEPGIYDLPILYDPDNSVDGQYVVWVMCFPYVFPGMEELQRNRLVLHPNPGHDGFWLDDITGHASLSDLIIYDMLGRQVMRAPLTSLKTWIDTSNLPSGVYMVHVHDGPAASSLKWVKE